MSKENRLIAVVRSAANPSPGQKHRSSGNFSTQGIPDGYNRLLWEIKEFETSKTTLDGVQFAVKEDRSSLSDPVKYSKIKSGSKTPIVVSRSLYIADPGGSPPNGFIVNIYATNL